MTARMKRPIASKKVLYQVFRSHLLPVNPHTLADLVATDESPAGTESARQLGL
jgi:hypothetical protein